MRPHTGMGTGGPPVEAAGVVGADVEVEVVQLDPDLPLPTYARAGDAGADLVRPPRRH